MIVNSLIIIEYKYAQILIIKQVPILKYKQSNYGNELNKTNIYCPSLLYYFNRKYLFGTNNK